MGLDGPVHLENIDTIVILAEETSLQPKKYTRTNRDWCFLFPVNLLAMIMQIKAHHRR